MAANSSFSKSEGAPYSISYPQEWADRDRMNYLLAPFPPSDQALAQNNPKYSFWSSFILSSSKELRTLIITEADLQERFKWNGHKSPKCLEIILEEMERTGQLAKVDEFCGARNQEGWVSWGVGLFKKPVSWAVGSYFSGSSKYTGGYVIKSMAEDLANAVMTDHQSSVLYKSTDSVMTYAAFETLCLKICSREAVPVVMQQLRASGFLARRRGEEDQDYDVIKLSSNKERSLSVAEVDIGIVRLKETRFMLSRQVATLEEGISQLKESARKKLREHDKPGALRFLRQSASKKQVLQKKEAMLDNVQNILHNIQSAETDALVFAAYKSGVNALRSIQKPQSLEKAEDLLDDLKELAEDAANISAVLSEDLTGDADDDDELLKELDDIASGSNAAAEIGLESAMSGLSIADPEALPSVPSHDPSIATTGSSSATVSPQTKPVKSSVRTMLPAS